jgi:4a-hydroxytetrahydrobiopterin dehydratase
MSRLLDDEERTRALAALPGWSGDEAAFVRPYTFTAFLRGVEAVSEVAAVAEQMDHHPDIDIRWRTVTFTVSTHSEGGVTQLDVELAHRISEIAAGHGAT